MALMMGLRRAKVSMFRILELPATLRNAHFFFGVETTHHKRTLQSRQRAWLIVLCDLDIGRTVVTLFLFSFSG